MLNRLSKKCFVPLVVYVVLTIVLTYPTAFRMKTHIPGGGDAPWFLWDLWWFKHAIVDLGVTPTTTDMIYHPLTDVPVTWQTPVNEFFTIPLQIIFGLVPLYNILFLGSFVLSGFFTYLLVDHIVDRMDLALSAGALFAFCSYRYVRGIGHLSLLTTQWMPLSLLLLLQCWESPSWRRGLLVGLGIGLVALSSPYYVAYFLLPVFLVGALYSIVWERGALRSRELWAATGAAAVVSAILVVPFYVTFLDLDPEMQAAVRSVADSVYTSCADVLSWVLPPARNPLWGSLTAPIYGNFSNPNLCETTVFFGFLPLVLAVASLFLWFPRPRRAFFWQLLGVTTLLLSFGPNLHVGGRVVWDWMPYRLFMLLPGSYAFRVPSRLGITAILAMLVADAMFAECLLERHEIQLKRLGVVVATSLGIFNSMYMFPFDSSSVAIPQIHRKIAKASRDFAVLELPAGERFFSKMSWYMYYQTHHQKRLVSGYLGRRPARLHQQERSMPFVRRFFSRQEDGFVDTPSNERVGGNALPDDIAMSEVILYDLGIRYVVLHCPVSEGSFCRPAVSLLRLGLGSPDYQEVFFDENLLLYEVEPAMDEFESSPIAHFSASQGTVSLLSYSLEGLEASENAPFRYALCTWWTCSGDLSRDYTLYVHYVDPSGDLLGQDDHVLGARFLDGQFTTSDWGCPGYYKDQAYIPGDLVSDGNLEVAIGLWVPKTGERLSPRGEAKVDDFGRVRLRVGNVE